MRSKASTHPAYDFEDTVIGQLKDAFGEVGAAFGFGFGKSGQQQKKLCRSCFDKVLRLPRPDYGRKGQDRCMQVLRHRASALRR